MRARVCGGLSGSTNAYFFPSLSTYSEFHSSEAVDHQPNIDKFFKLQDDLAQTRLIMQSLTYISPLKTSETSSTVTVKEVLDLACERKRNANSWIKSAVASDLRPVSSSLKTSNSANIRKKFYRECCKTKPKGPYIVPKQHKNDESSIFLASSKDEQLEWAKGSSMCSFSDLATCLQDECQRWFLSYVEKYLDEVESKASLIQSDSKIAGIMLKIKRINDWLDAIVSKEDSLDDLEKETCGRLKVKIYGILLKNVERTAMALEHANTSS